MSTFKNLLSGEGKGGGGWGGGGGVEEVGVVGEVLFSRSCSELTTCTKSSRGGVAVTIDSFR